VGAKHQCAGATGVLQDRVDRRVVGDDSRGVRPAPTKHAFRLDYDLSNDGVDGGR
jgi:hypothetical protein